MAQPAAYVPAHEFLTDEAANPNFPGSELDIEFNALKRTTDETRTNLAKIQRDDGALKNGVVHLESLDATVSSLLGISAEVTVSGIQFNSLATVTASTLGTDTSVLSTTGYYEAGDGGAAMYKRVDAEPSHNGKVQSRDGAWWEIVPGIEGINVQQLGAKWDDDNDDTPGFQDTIDVVEYFGGGRVLLPPGTGRVTQVAVPAFVDIYGCAIRASTIRGVGDVDTIVTSEGWQEQKFVNFRVTHDLNPNVGANIKLMHIKHGSNGSEFDLELEGLAGVSDGGFVLRGVNPDTGIANNNQYNNKMRLRLKRPNGGSEVDGVAIWLFGESVSNGLCNSNRILPGSLVNSWSKALYIKGALNHVQSLQINPSSSYGIRILSDSDGECTDNALNQIGFDSTWVTDKIQLISNSDTFEHMATIIGCAITGAQVAVSGTGAAKAKYSMFGRAHVLGGAGSSSSFDPSVSGGISRKGDEGVLVVQGGEALVNAKLLLAGSGFATAQALTGGGASIMLDGAVAGAEFRVVTTTNGTTATQLFAFTLDGKIRFGNGGPTWSTGLGSPESVVTAPKGSLYTDQTGGKLYVKETGSAATGWVVK